MFHIKNHIHKNHERNVPVETTEEITEEQTKENYISELEEAIDNFTQDWNILNKDFSVSRTNKFHTIESHVLDYTILTGKTLGETIDQVIETTHQYFNKRLDDSNYKVKNKVKEIHGKRLKQAVDHT